MKKELYEKILQEDPVAISQLYEQCKLNGIKIARAIVKDEYVAEDMFHEAFVRALNYFDKFDQNLEFEPWFHTILSNISKSYLRKNKPANFSDIVEDEKILYDSIPDVSGNYIPENCIDYQETKMIIDNMLHEIPDKQREAIVLFYYGGLSIAEIAKYQNSPEETVKSRLFQGKSKIKKAVEAYEDKTKVKLHSVGLIPLLYTFFQSDIGKVYAAELHLDEGVNAFQQNKTYEPIQKSATRVAQKASVKIVRKLVIGVITVTCVGGILGGVIYSSSNKNDEIVQIELPTESAEAIVQVPAEVTTQEIISVVDDIEKTETPIVQAISPILLIENNDSMDAILKQAWEYYKTNDYHALTLYDGSEEVGNIVKELFDSNTDCDRYFYFMPEDKIYAMIYYDQGWFWWYFGEMKNGAREGKGEVFCVYGEDMYERFVGTYKNDVPDGEGYYYSENPRSYYSLTGEYHGMKLDGIYDVICNNFEWLTNEVKTTVEFKQGVPTVTYDMDYLPQEEGKTFFLYVEENDNFAAWNLSNEKIESGFSIFMGNEAFDISSTD